MPATETYVVTETRTIEVTATNPLDAARLAGAAFEHQPKPADTNGNASAVIKTVALNVRKKSDLYST